MNILTNQFNDNKTFFQRRFDALSYQVLVNISAAMLFETVNYLDDNFEFGNLTKNKFKILLLALSLQDTTLIINAVQL